MRALTGRALLLPPDSEAAAVEIIERAAAIARGETVRPLSAADALQAAGGAAYARLWRAVAERCWDAALQLRHAHAPGSLAEAASLSGSLPPSLRP